MNKNNKKSGVVGSNITIRALFAPNPVPTPLYIKTNYLAYTMQIRITLFALAFIPDMPCPAKTYYGTLGSIVIMSYLYSLYTANSLEEGGQREKWCWRRRRIKEVSIYPWMDRTKRNRMKALRLVFYIRPDVVRIGRTERRQ